MRGESLQPGDPVPPFDLPLDTGGRISPRALRGRPYVLYFYPKDDTSGCTKEAVAFSALLDAFQALGVEVIGVSRDSLASHARFRSKHGLSVKLASDEDGKACEAFGVWTEKSLYGRRYMGIDRSTFLVDADGRIARVWRKVRVPGHAEEVLEAARALVAGQAS
ncbi:Putative peroxiredoxin bcp [bacterium HR40]|nr:Putative peroxiredoxin bcp [bacterium HR40]